MMDGSQPAVTQLLGDLMPLLVSEDNRHAGSTYMQANTHVCVSVCNLNELSKIKSINPL